MSSSDYQNVFFLGCFYLLFSFYLSFFTELIVNGSQTIITKTVINSHELNDEKRNVSGIYFTVFLTNKKYTKKSYKYNQVLYMYVNIYNAHISINLIVMNYVNVEKSKY